MKTQSPAYHTKILKIVCLSTLLITAILWSTIASATPLKHLVAPDSAADCYECHKKATPKIAEDWYQSKHGVQLMKCFVCHGQPDGKGSIPWAVVPSPKAVCQKCHDPAMQRMRNKYGLEPDCYTCHPFHQNSLHHDAYKKSASKAK